MTILQIIFVSTLLISISSLTYYKKNIKIKKKSKVVIIISPFLLMFTSLLVSKIEYSGTIIYKLYGWPHSFLTYKMKDVVDNTPINEWIFNTHNLLIYLIFVYLFYLSLTLFITMFIKLTKKTQRNALIVIFILIAVVLSFAFLSNKYTNKKVMPTPTINEEIHQVIEITEDECSIASDCKLPAEYGIRSNCPYQAICLNNQCSIICPEVTEWDRIKQAISNCNVESVFQTHSLRVTVKLKNGDTIEDFEPQIDDVFDVVKKHEDKCGKIILATE